MTAYQHSDATRDRISASVAQAWDIRRDEHPDAAFYIPDDARLRMFAAEIQQQRESVALAGDDDDTTKPRKDSEDNNVSSLFMPLSSTATHEGVIAGDINLSAEEIERAEKVKLSGRRTSRLTTVDVALLLRQAGMTIEASSTAPVQRPSDLTAVLKRLKDKNNSVARSIAFNWGLEFRQVNSTLNGRLGIRSITHVDDPEILEKRLAMARTWLRSGESGEASSA